MRALVLEDFGRMAVQEREIRSLPAGYARIAIDAVGICGTDLHGFTGANGRRVAGQVMGHEAAGHIVELGPGVKGVDVDQRVTFNPVIGCGACALCEMGQTQQCERVTVIGVAPDWDGAYATLVSVPARAIVTLPPGMSPVHGALAEPVAVGLHAVRRAGVLPGDSVLILGGGPIGQSAVLAARHEGAGRIIVSEPDPPRRALAESLGVVALDPREGLQQHVRLNGGLVDRAIDAVGSAASLQDAVACLVPDGVVALVGMAAPTLQWAPYALVTAERSIVGSYCYSHQDFVEAVALVAATPGIGALVTEIVALDEAPSMFSRLAHQGDVAGKVLISMGPPID